MIFLVSYCVKIPFILSLVVTTYLEAMLSPTYCYPILSLVICLTWSPPCKTDIFPCLADWRQASDHSSSVCSACLFLALQDIDAAFGYEKLREIKVLLLPED